jgi:serine protease
LIFLLMTIRSILVLVLVPFLASACGGGSSSSPIAVNQPPVADFSAVITSEVDPLTISFDANASSDSDGSISSYSWDFGDGNTATGTTVSHRFAMAGSYDIVLTVTDDDGATHSLTKTTQITTSLVATFSLSGADTGPTPYTLTFDASDSEVLGASEGLPNIVSYQWDFGDGETGSGVSVSHTFVEPDTYTVTLSVIDSSGDTDTAQTTVKTGFRVSGTISAASSSSVDIDVNDPSRQNRSILGAAFQANDAFGEAQPLPNPVILNGFVSVTGSGTPPIGSSNFQFDGDSEDFYSAHLLAGQFVSLQVSDFDPSFETVFDVDLELYNSNLELVRQSISITASESVAVDTEGDYFILVRAFAGINKYVLNIGTTSLVTGARAYGNSADFVLGEAIVKMKPASAVSINAAHIKPMSAMSHKDPSRAALTRFTISDVQSAVASTSTSNKLAKTIIEKNHKKLATLDYIKKLNTRPDVEYAEPNYRVHAMRVPNDDFYYLQAHYPQINLPQAWDITTGTPASGSVVVAVVDTGVVLSHVDLDEQFVDSNDDFDFISNADSSADGDGIDADPDDPGDGVGNNPDSWHGTHVAGTIAAATDNNQGVAGVSWGAKIMPIRVLGRDGGSTYDVEQGVRFAAGLANDSGTVPSQPADIINLSLGGAGFSSSSQNLYNQVRAAGVIVIASAGNENISTPSYPASYNNVISVSAVDLNNNLAPYSNFGSLIDIAAPGGDLSVDRNSDGYKDGVLSTLIDKIGSTRNPSYSFYQGTSMAAPHVAGVAALMKAVYPGLTPAEFDGSLQSGSLTDDIGVGGFDTQFGFGLVNALKAVQQAQIFAGGSATGSLIASPTLVDFGPVLSTSSLTLTQVGNTPPNVTSVTKSAPWLTIDNSNIAANGSGTYALTVNRNALADATYTDNIVVSLDNGNTLNIPVSMRVQSNVQTSQDVGFLFVVLLNADDATFVDQFNVDVSEGEYQYEFNNISFGDYIIVGGSDVDNDFTICGPGESCGRYPTNDQPLRITIDGEDIDDLDFLANIASEVISSAQVGAKKNQGIERIYIKPIDEKTTKEKSVQKSAAK